MSLDTTDAVSTSPSTRPGGSVKRKKSVDQDGRWKELQENMKARAKKFPASELFGPSATGGSVYRWGVAASRGAACDPVTECLSRLAADASPKKSTDGPVDIPTAAEKFLETIDGSLPTLGQSAAAVTWAAAMAALSRRLESPMWWDLLGGLQQLRETALQRAEPESPQHLLLAGELGLTLAWRVGELSSCQRLAKPSADEVAAWIDGEEESIAEAVRGAVDARLVLASLVRLGPLMQHAAGRKWKKRQREICTEMATWVAAMTTHTGETAFSPAARGELKDDLARDGLLQRASEFEPESLEPATEAALGESQSGGRLAWEVSLPESMLHCEEARLAVLMPEWDVRRGRIHLDYDREDPRIEMDAGRSRVLAGDWQVMIDVDGDAQHADGEWECTCEYSDDDVHYLEIEQPWSGGVTLQRQVMLIRDDRCVLLADSVLAAEPADPSADQQTQPAIRYTARLPLADGTTTEPEAETREVYLGDSKRRGLAFPLSASEWRVGSTQAKLETSDDRHLVLSAQGRGRLYAPLWLDFQSRRFKRKRTWRQLTVADELRIVGPDEAAGFRIQIGSEQWLVYRSLGLPRCRTVLGKHLIADFFCGRFDPGDGSLEELMTVDGGEDDDE